MEANLEKWKAVQRAPSALSSLEASARIFELGGILVASDWSRIEAERLRLVPTRLRSKKGDFSLSQISFKFFGRNTKRLLGPA